MARVKTDTTATLIINYATITSNETPPVTKGAETTVNRQVAVQLSFPLPGYTPYTAPVSTIMDNSVLDRTPIEFYADPPGLVIQAFNGETRRKAIRG